MSSREFEFPAIHDFPPFYTRQPTETTWQSQAQQWMDLILQYARHHRMFTLSLHQATSPGESPLFENARLQRRLSEETLQEIVELMVQQGTAKWDNGKSQALLFWHKAEDWAEILLQWVNKCGLNNTIVTFYEITQGDLAVDQEFYGMPASVLQVCLQVLVKRGVAQIFKGSGDSDDMGIKFFQ
ncbi:ESCRT-II complex, vps25 subunit [Hesseltinella vesiculosa]|uniref:Vacuolar protein-sorting-associated protein 25 n=1 Tax=Hesseltinella vesiculosa TaxID=101127 RepID=A0A1X2G5K5_9FUNG|nr:ESCRT-II complex, vps25 subunit [Hesseltinella vesiculosa]